MRRQSLKNLYDKEEQNNKLKNFGQEPDKRKDGNIHKKE
jgi:hypothetical protein